jgi:hypothetical protein
MKLIGIAAALACAGIAVPALAQTRMEGEIVVSPMRAPRGAVEIGAELGYTQGFGALRQGATLRDVAGAGIGVGASVGVRVTPTFSIGATGQFQSFNANEMLALGTSVRGASAGVEGTFHIAPYERADPWVSVGGGYRVLWEVPSGAEPTTMTHGFEVGRVQVGVDLRPSENVAVAPVIGASVDTFLWQKSTGAENAKLTTQGLSTYVFAGVQGRFDVGGARESKVVEVR